eukprot:TRINITY_DN3262_c0_g1_i23.p1 TRINITY_DN3262_c0_g1~~TRINITY_DN3262_c0_g1_i23.p1  ORF type:complete len:67 (+),score=13.95 TRINITY_DN3262_c0_g1_i23:99-299(+)
MSTPSLHQQICNNTLEQCLLLKNSNKHYHDRLSELCDILAMFKLMSKAQLAASIRKRGLKKESKTH